MVCCLSLQPLVQEQSIDTSFQEDYPNPSLFHNEIVILQLNKQKRQIRNLPHFPPKYFVNISKIPYKSAIA